MVALQVSDAAFGLYTLLVVGRALLSWFNPDPYHPLVRFLCRATDPLLDRMRRWLPLVFGGIDFAPIALLVGLSFLQRLVRMLLLSLTLS